MRRLHRLKAKEISLTAAGANRRVMALLKSAKGGPMTETTEELRDQVRKAVADVPQDVLDRLDEVIAKAEGSGDRELTARAAGVIKAIGRLLAPHAGEIKSSDIMAACKAAGLDSPQAAEDLGKSASDDGEDDDEEDIDDDAAEDDEDEEAEEDEEDDDDDEEADAANKSVNIAPASDIAQDRKAALTAPGSEPLTSTPKGASVAKAAQAPVEKSAAFEELRKSNQSLAAQVEALTKAAGEAEALRKAEASARELAEIKKSVTDDFGHLGLDADIVAPALQSLKGKEDQTHYNAMVDVLKKSADYRKQMEGPSGLFRSVGHSRTAPATNGDPEAELDAYVKSQAGLPEHQGKTAQQVYRDVVKSAKGLQLKQNIRKAARGDI